jgi:hypothetical protein
MERWKERYRQTERWTNRDIDNTEMKTQRNGDTERWRHREMETQSDGEKEKWRH